MICSQWRLMSTDSCHGDTTLKIHQCRLSFLSACSWHHSDVQVASDSSPRQTGGRYTEQVFTPAHTLRFIYRITVTLNSGCYIQVSMADGRQIHRAGLQPAHTHTPLYIQNNSYIKQWLLYTGVHGRRAADTQSRSSHQQTHTHTHTLLYIQNNSYIKQWLLYTVVVIYRCPWQTCGRYTEQVFTPANTLSALYTE